MGELNRSLQGLGCRAPDQLRLGIAAAGFRLSHSCFVAAPPALRRDVQAGRGPTTCRRARAGRSLDRRAAHRRAPPPATVSCPPGSQTLEGHAQGSCSATPDVIGHYEAAALRSCARDPASTTRVFARSGSRSAVYPRGMIQPAACAPPTWTSSRQRFDVLVSAGGSTGRCPRPAGCRARRSH